MKTYSLRQKQILIGFAAETGGLGRAADKLRRKGVDLLVANDVAEPGSGFGTDTNRNGIQDTGEGIAAEQLPHVFEPFYRGGNGRGDDPSHLGLGLFLVRSHVEALSGQCHIESRPGSGTVLQISLPEPKQATV